MVFLNKAAISPSVEKRAVSMGSDMVIVQRVIDGDTFRTDTGERVRLIGIDTPELHESAKLSRDAAKSGQDVETIKRLGRKSWLFVNEMLAGQRVRLEFDVQARDKYGRLLAYVYLEDGTFVNMKIIAEGYAYPLTIPPDVRFSKEFKKAFETARASSLGLWAK